MGTLRYLIATPSDRECTVVASQDDDSLVPLASVFKLYVLGAVVDAVGGGEIGWDAPVEIRDELDSLGGPTAEEEPGTELSVRELATRMISVSDNTATDHLMDFVGRESVEQIQTVMGHSQPSVNAPMLTGRELTILKFSGDADLAERYIARAKKNGGPSSMTRFRLARFLRPHRPRSRCSNTRTQWGGLVHQEMRVELLSG